MSLKINILRFYQDNLYKIGCVFKISDDIVYARGLLKVQMSEMVKFKKEGESMYGIVNYLDSEGFTKNKKKRIRIKKVIKRFYHLSMFNMYPKIKVIDIEKVVNEGIEIVKDISLSMKKLRIDKVKENKQNIGVNSKHDKIIEDHKYIVNGNITELNENQIEEGNNMKIISIVTSSYKTLITLNNKNMIIPTIPVNFNYKETGWEIKNLSFKQDIEKLNSNTESIQLPKDVIEYIKLNKALIESKLPGLNEYEIIKHMIGSQ